MPRRFADKVVIITGGSRGQGREEGSRFASEGATVILADVLDDDGEIAARAIRDGGGRATYEHLDVSQQADWDRVVKTSVSQHGTIDILVNNAGVAMRVGIMDTSTADWERILSINLTGPFLGIQAVVPIMARSGGGVIVNTGSIAGLLGHITGAYAASKWGLRGLSQSSAREFAEWGIRVNTVHPGVVNSAIVTGDENFVSAMTAMTPLGRPGEIGDVASVVLFLASDEAAFITGQDIAVDGGFTTGGAFNRVASDWPEYRALAPH